MKKFIAAIFAFLLVMLFSACSDNVNNITENTTDEVFAEDVTNQDLSISIEKEDSSVNVSTGSIKLEDATSAYVEPDFKVVSTLAECYDYFELASDDVSTTETNPDGSISMITVTDKNDKIKATMKFTYDEKVIATATFFYEDSSTEKVAFSFYDENTINIIAHVDKESNMSFYFYNKDGSFNSYLDSAGFSSLIVGSALEGLGGVISQ